MGGPSWIAATYSVIQGATRQWRSAGHLDHLRPGSDQPHTDSMPERQAEDTDVHWPEISSTDQNSSPAYRRFDIRSKNLRVYHGLGA